MGTWPFKNAFGATLASPLYRRRLFLVGVALAALVAAGGTSLSARDFVRSTERAEGVVAYLRAGDSHPQIQFTTASGETVSYPQNGWIWGYHAGDRVTVLYNPRRPRDAEIDVFGAIWSIPMLFAALGAFFLVTALLDRSDR